MTKKSFLDKYIFPLAFLFTIPATWALLVPGFFGASDDLHIGWMHQMHETVKLLQFPARFVPDLSFGFGYPLFNFYAPLPFYLGEIFHLLGFGLVDSVKAVFFISFPVSMFFMYKLLRRYSSAGLALLGSLIYIYAPYRATDVYVRGAIGEIVVFMFLPLVILYFLKALDSEKINLKWVGAGGITLSLIIVSHNITAIMLFPFLVLLVALYFFFGKNKKSSLLNFFAILLFGFVISSFFWVPALFESGLMKYDTVFNYWDHYPTVKQLVTPYFGYGASVPGPGDGMSFFVGIPSLTTVAAFLLIGLLTFKKFRRIDKLLFIWLSITLFVSLFMMNHRSKVLWDNLPLLPYFQFPWRFLTVVVLITSIMTMFLEKLKINRYLVYFLCSIVVVVNYKYFKPQDFLGRQDNYFLNRYIPTPSASEEYKTTSEEYLRLPAGTLERPSENFPRFYTGDETPVEQVIINSLDAKAYVNSKTSSKVFYSKYYFPGWRATVDKKPVDIESAEPYGQISIDVPPGSHEIEVFFRETLFRKFFNLLSAVGLVVALYLAIKFRNQK